MNAKIIKIILVVGGGPDKLLLFFDLPSGISSYENEPATATMECAYGTGEKYAKEHFSEVPLEIVRF